MLSLFVLLALAGGCCFLLDARPTGPVPASVLDAQRRLVGDVAGSISSAATDRARNLELLINRIPERERRDPGTLAGLIARDRSRWRGVAVVDGSGRAVLASAGREPVPVEQLPATTRPAPGLYSARVRTGPRILTVLPLRGGTVLVTSSAVRVRPARLDTAARSALLVLDGSGNTQQVQGEEPAGADREPVRQAGRAGATRAGHTVRGGSGGAATLVCYAPVGATERGVADHLQLAVVALTHSTAPPPARPWRGPVAGLALAALAVAGYLLVRIGLVRPLHRLRRHATAVAGDGRKPHSRYSRVDEIARIGTALNHAATVLHGMGGRRSFGSRRPLLHRIPAGTAVLLVAALIAGWSVTMLGTIGVSRVAVPDHLLVDSEDQLDSAADSLRRGLDTAVADLTAVAPVLPTGDAGPARGGLQHLMDARNRYRSVYLTDRNGRPAVRVGREPLRAPARPPAGDGVHQANTSGRLPVIYADAALPDHQHWLVAEFDVNYLTNLLARPGGGQIRVVDSRLRVVLGTNGFLAFHQLPGGPLRDAARQAQQDRPTSGIRDVEGSGAVVSAEPLADPAGQAGQDRPGWTLVAERPVSQLPLDQNTVRKRATLFALLGLAVALAVLGWYTFGVIRPLRALARRADWFVAGDTNTVIYPVRHDEVGVLAVCLDICRQATVDGLDRLGGALRLRTADGIPAVLVLSQQPCPGLPCPGLSQPGPVQPGRTRPELAQPELVQPDLSWLELPQPDREPYRPAALASRGS